MPPKAAWRKHFEENREEKVARCKIGGCKKPEVKLFIKGSRVGAGNPTSHLKKYHQDVWSQYTEKKKSDDSQKEAEKKKSEEASEMEDSQRINTRTRAGQLPFLSKALPEVPEPTHYWAEDDPRAVAAHQGILALMVMDAQPFGIVVNKGFLIKNRLTLPHLKVHGPQWYASRLDQVYKNAIGDLQKKLQADNPESIWVLMDGWSAVTTSYLGLEICTPNILFILVEPL